MGMTVPNKSRASNQMITKFKCPECGHYNHCFLQRFYNGYFFPLTCRSCNAEIVPHFAFSVLFTVVEQALIIWLAFYCFFTMDLFRLVLLLTTFYVLLQILRLAIVPLVKKGISKQREHVDD